MKLELIHESMDSPYLRRFARLRLTWSKRTVESRIIDTSLDKPHAVVDALREMIELIEGHNPNPS